MQGVVNTIVTAEGTLKIFVGNQLLATVEDGRSDEDFVEDILYGMGYRWNKDGTITPIK